MDSDEGTGSGTAAPPAPESPSLLSFLAERWVVLAAFCWLAAGALYLTLPPSPDQFEHAYLGWRLFEGDVPYRDFLDMNWPGVIGLHAAAAALFGNHLWSWRALDFLLLAMSAFFLSGLVGRAGGRDAGRLTLLFYPLLYVSLSYWVPGQHDMSATQFLLGALWFHLRAYETGKPRWQIGTGLFLAAAMLNKPTVGIMALLLPLQALWLKTPVRSVLLQTAVAGAASLLTLLAALGAVLMRGATLREVQEALVTFNAETQFLGSVPLHRMAWHAVEVFGRWWPALTAGSLPAAFWMFRKPNRSIAGTALPMLWLTGLLSYFIQRRGFAYHLSPCVPALAGGVVLSIVLLSTGRVSLGNVAWRRRLAAGFVLLVLGGCGAKLAASYASLASALVARDYGRYLAGFGENDGVTVADAVAFVRRLEALPPDEPVLVVGSASSINYLSKRRQPTRFYLFHVLFLSTPPLPMADRWVDLWERDLNGADVRYCLIARSIRTDWLQGDSRAARALRGFLERYRRSEALGTDGGIDVYERK